MNRPLLDAVHPFARADLPEAVEYSLVEHGVGRSFATSHGSGSVLAVGLLDGRVALYDVITRSLAKVLVGHTHEVYSVHFARDAARLVSSSLDYTVRVWQLPSGASETCVRFEAMVARVSVHPAFGRTRLCAVSQTGQEVLLVQLPRDAGEVRVNTCPMVWRLTGGEEGGVGDEELAVPRPVRLSRAATPSPSAMVTALPPALAAGAAAPLSYLVAEFDRTGRALVSHSAARAGVLEVYAVHAPRDPPPRTTDASRIQVTFLYSHAMHSKAFAKQIQFGERGDRVLVLCHDRTVRLFAWEAPRLAADGTVASPGHLQPLWDYKDRISPVMWRWAIFAANDEYLVAATASAREHRFYVWDLQSTQLVRQFEGQPRESLSMFTYHSNLHAFFALTYDRGELHVYHRSVPQNWSSFAPSFQELAENVEYVEAEDEFDFDADGRSVYDRRRRKTFHERQEEDVYVEVLGSGRERMESGGVSDHVDAAGGSGEDRETEPALLYVPVELPRDLPAIPPEASALQECRAERTRMPPNAECCDEEEMERARVRVS
ncbi:hypothetical protein CDCA_CDCA13G3733 [Cyanidium caldarium]|uniref:Uncharacterized protein n=1 Tax=Cyanidium caldarium TaxID=2771 RepID=A0AAV9J0Z8_CYACA|nr:hypothetical protein CDCA_CDCA13G3733 [Cyanidium caldarium]